MDDAIGGSKEPMGEVPLVGLGKSELERLRREAGGMTTGKSRQ